MPSSPSQCSRQPSLCGRPLVRTSASWPASLSSARSRLRAPRRPRRSPALRSSWSMCKPWQWSRAAAVPAFGSVSTFSARARSSPRRSQTRGTWHALCAGGPLPSTAFQRWLCFMVFSHTPRRPSWSPTLFLRSVCSCGRGFGFVRKRQITWPRRSCSLALVSDWPRQTPWSCPVTVCCKHCDQGQALDACPLSLSAEQGQWLVLVCTLPMTTRK
mmetsp:Transcript_19360/g.64908  ORF Transcript_19360/g.64908 Transcript_19360/m.64908 type:complete len:215 (+) Transcript_19360:511-1155(+)